MLNEENKLVHSILNETRKLNLDNVSRTNAYLQFYQEHTEILWCFLAHMVSRNAGWNMCDLEGEWLPQLIDKKMREMLYLTYERANWLIFQDAYPQLLLYQLSKRKKQPMFHLLKYFQVSLFMEKEWNAFWLHQDRKRLLFSLIINEQNVIQKPVIHHPFYQKKVFHSAPFCFQDWFHFSAVLLPTCNGSLFGASVTGFRKVNKRIELGKKIAAILFHKQIYPLVYEFAVKTIHTGSRYDYECYFMKGKNRDTPFLRMVFPIIDHYRGDNEDWSLSCRIPMKWYKDPVIEETIFLTDWYREKQKQLHKLVLFKQLLE